MASWPLLPAPLATLPSRLSKSDLFGMGMAKPCRVWGRRRRRNNRKIAFHPDVSTNLDVSLDITLDEHPHTPDRGHRRREG